MSPLPGCVLSVHALCFYKINNLYNTPTYNLEFPIQLRTHIKDNLSDFNLTGNILHV